MIRVVHSLKRNCHKGKLFHNLITQPHFVKPPKKNNNKRFYQQVAGTYSKQKKITKYFAKGMMLLYGSALLAHFVHEGREKVIFLEYEHFLQDFGINPNIRQIDDLLSSVEQKLELLHATEEEAKRKDFAKKRQQQIAAVLKDENVDVDTIVRASPSPSTQNSEATTKVDSFTMRSALVTLLLSSTIGFVAFPIYYIASRNLQHQLARTDEFTRRMQKRLPSVYSIYLFTQLHQICFVPRLLFESLLHPSNFLHLFYKPNKRDPKTLAGEKYLRLYEYDKKTFGEDSFVTLMRKCEATANGAHPSWYFSPRVLLTFLTYALNEIEGRNSSMSMPLIFPKTTRRDISSAERQLENELLPIMYFQKALLMTFLLHKSAKDWKHGAHSSSASLAERQVFQKEALTAFEVALNEAALIDDEFFRQVKRSREKFHKIIDLEEDTEHQ